MTRKMKKSELKKLIREELKKLPFEIEGWDFERETLTEKEIKKCYTCEGSRRGADGACKHTGSVQGSRGSECMSWWECNLECGRRRGKVRSKSDKRY